MKKVRKITTKLAEELLSLRSNRKSIDEYLYSFLDNFHENCKLTHSLIVKGKTAENIYKAAFRQYFVFLVSCWETYFRDVFVYIHSRDEELTAQLVERMIITTNTDNDFDITLPELLSKSFNFQNINDLEDAYNGLWGGDFLRHVCTSGIAPCGINGKFFPALSVESIITDWRDIIDEVFSIRHKAVHDANFRPEINIELIQSAEILFLLIPQFSSHMLAHKFKLPYILMSDGETSAPYIFSIQDILADDWFLYDDSPEQK